MPDIVDSLLVTLGLDAKGMEQGAKDAEKAQNKIQADANKSADVLKKRDKQSADALKAKGVAEAKEFKDQQDRSKKLAKGLSKIRNEVLALGTAYLGVKAISELTSANAETGRKSQTLGVGVSDLKAQEGAAKNLGASMEDLDDILRNINKTGEDLQNQIMPSIDAMNALYRAADKANKAGAKVDISKYFDATTTAEARQKMLRDVFSHINAKDAAYLGSKAGFSESQVRLLQIDPAKWDAQLAKQKQLISLNEKNTQSAAELKQKFGELEDGIEGVANNVVNDLTPGLMKLGDVLQGVTAIAKDSPKATEAVVGLGVAVGGAFSVYKIFRFISAIKNGITALVAIKAAAEGAAVATAAVGSAEAAVATGAAATGALTSTAGVAAAGIVGYGVGTGISAITNKILTKIKGSESTIGTSLYDLFHKKKSSETQQQKANTTAVSGTPSVAAPVAPAVVAPAPVSAPTYAPTATTAPAAISGVPTDISKAAQASQQKYGIPADVTIAQWKLESASGTHMPTGSNNPFGIKAKAGEAYVEALTTEFINGVKHVVLQRFKKFDTIAEAFDAHAKLLATGKAYSEARKHENDPKAFAEALTGKYATDPLYGDKLKKLMQSGLAPDKALLTGSSASASKNSINNSNSTSTSTTTVSVGQVHVNTNESTAPGISKDISKSLQTYVFAANSNTGLS